MDKFKEVHIIEGCFAVDSSISAVLIHIPNVGNLWFPDSQIALESEVKGVGDRGKLIISMWLAKEKRLIK